MLASEIKSQSDLYILDISLNLRSWLPITAMIHKMMNEQSSDISQELALLHTLSGALFSRHVEIIARRSEFRPIENESNVFSTGSGRNQDYANLLNAARKCVAHGYRVYILPNPKSTRTADFILERKGTFRMYDLKTISGRASVRNRLLESIGQANQVILNMNAKYNPRLLAKDLMYYFHINPSAIEVIIFKGNQLFLVKRMATEDKEFVKKFMQKFSR